MRTSRVPSTGAAELMNFNRLVLGSCFTSAHGRCRGGLHVPELRTRRLTVFHERDPFWAYRVYSIDLTKYLDWAKGHFLSSK